jgi:RNA polymerase sigma factor (sigma-70 family)
MIATRSGNTDCELVAAVRDGDDAAFEELYGRYRPRIASYVRGMVRDEGRAEDVTQEAFLSALRRLRETDSEIVFKPWIYRIARNQAIDHHRRTSRAEEISMDAERGLRPSDHPRLVDLAAPDTALVAKQRLDHLCGAFDELSDVQSRVIVMRELEGRSYREIAERLELTRPAVEGALFRARRRLESEYEQLAEGRRCAGMRTTIARLAEGVGGKTDEARLGRHARRCSLCRRRARELGVEPISTLTRVRSKVAALLPLPWGFGSGGGGGQVTGMLTERAAALAAVAAIGAGGAVVGAEKIGGGGGERPASDRGAQRSVERRAAPMPAHAPRSRARQAPRRATPATAPATRRQRGGRREHGAAAKGVARQAAPAAPGRPAAPVDPPGRSSADPPPSGPGRDSAPASPAPSGAPAPAPAPEQAPPPPPSKPAPIIPQVVESLPLPEVQVPQVQLPAPPPGAPGSNLVGGVNRLLDGVTRTVNDTLP